MITTFSDKEFDSDSRGARAATVNGAVVITVDGEPAQVVMAYAVYQKLTGTDLALLGSTDRTAATKPTDEISVAAALYYSGVAEIDLESYLPRRTEVPRDVDFE